MDHWFSSSEHVLQGELREAALPALHPRHRGPDSLLLARRRTEAGENVPTAPAGEARTEKVIVNDSVTFIPFVI